MDIILEELIIKAQKGDKDALDKLIKREQNNIYTTLYYLKKDEVDLTDILQNILIKMSKKLNQLRNPKYFKTWLNQIILNSYYDYLRKHKRHIEKFSYAKSENDNDSEIELPDYDTNPQNAILQTELDMVIKNSIKNLPIHYKIPIALREIQGLSYDEISNITRTSIGTVKSRIARARKIIKDDINKYTEG